MFFTKFLLYLTSVRFGRFSQPKHYFLKWSNVKHPNSGGQLSQLKKHKASKHKGTRYPCDQCSHVATTKDLLNQHVQLSHKDLSLLGDQCDYTAHFVDRIIREDVNIFK